MSQSKRGPYKAKIPSPKDIPGRHDLILKDQAISFIAENIMEGEGMRHATRDRVSKRVNYAIQNGQLVFEEEKIKFGLLMAWARDKKKWSKALSQYPRIVEMDFTENACISAANDFLKLPDNLETCREALNKEHQEKVQLTEDLRQAQKEIDHLRPKAERYDIICENSRKSARKRRT